MPLYRVDMLCRIEYFLMLKPIMDKGNDTAIFGPFPTYQEALDHHDNYRVPQYEDEVMSDTGKGLSSQIKYFKKNCPLDGCLALTEQERQGPTLLGYGVHERQTTLREMSRTLVCP
jgi:hypothetical protein